MDKINTKARLAVETSTQFESRLVAYFPRTERRVVASLQRDAASGCYALAVRGSDGYLHTVVSAEQFQALVSDALARLDAEEVAAERASDANLVAWDAVLADFGLDGKN